MKNVSDEKLVLVMINAELELKPYGSKLNQNRQKKNGSYVLKYILSNKSFALKPTSEPVSE